MTGYTVTLERIEEHVVPGKPLGRHVAHDSRSLAFQVRAADPALLVSVAHRRRIGILDQGDLGSCTGNAAVGALGTDPIFGSLPAGTLLDEAAALDLYSAATVLDPFTGAYPPQDTGSDGLSVAKAAKAAGLISGYQHATSLTAALTALQTGPVITGVNWYEGFDSPDSSGRVRVSGSNRGGHEFEVVGVDVAARTVRAANSWGTGWGDNGYFEFSWDDWDRLLHEQGDVTVFVPLTAPAPTPTPPPAPVVDPVDQALVTAVEPWARTITSTKTAAGKAKAGYTAWKTAKGIA